MPQELYRTSGQRNYQNESAPEGRTPLFLEFELLCDLAVSLWMLCLKILEMSLPICDHRKETAARMPVLLMLLEMLCELLYL